MILSIRKSFLLLRSRCVNSQLRIKWNFPLLSCRNYWLRLLIRIKFFTLAFSFLAKTITVVPECVNTIGYSMCKTRKLQHFQRKSIASHAEIKGCSKVLFGAQLHHIVFRWRFFFPSLSTTTNDTLKQYTKVSNVWLWNVFNRKCFNFLARSRTFLAESTFPIQLTAIL